MKKIIDNYSCIIFLSYFVSNVSPLYFKKVRGRDNEDGVHHVALACHQPRKNYGESFLIFYVQLRQSSLSWVRCIISVQFQYDRIAMRA
jgi:hypothetical protein